MGTYNYSAFSKDGKRVSGLIEAANQQEVEAKLINLNLYPISITENITVKLKGLLNQEITGISEKDKIAVISQLSTMLSAGIPVNKAFDIIVSQAEKMSIKQKLQNVHKMIQAGKSLSDAFSLEKGILNEIEINLLRAGEKSGNLIDVLNKIKNDSLKAKNFKGKLRGALIYPVLILLVILIVLFVMIFFMIPQVKSLYESFGSVDLPPITQFLVWLSDIILNPVNVVIILLTLLVAYLLYRYYYSTQDGKLNIDKLKLKFPITGPLIINANISNITKIMSMLLGSGVSVTTTFEIVEKSISNKVFKDIIRSSINEILAGNSIAVSIAKHNQKIAFPNFIIQMISAGEESGNLVSVLNDISEYYYQELDQKVSNLTKSLEPIILIVVGLLVAFLAVAIYLPIYQAGNIISS
ncbi:type II secretion system F family protein [Candidatus Dojkabacteria bacterium]|uniref:Type II secretion system F family protein n=1 Tax=Candidatus Dojkabacteria bacterium TaxID=2099670 RepID=A0A3M0YYP4_9BACT|nr:MAG: type II secretion system F family protein [Candidatus Dojkabacteria bacterium]